jgi:hypothetical protein
VTTVIYFISPKTDSSFTMTESTLTAPHPRSPKLVDGATPNATFLRMLKRELLRQRHVDSFHQRWRNHGHLGLIMSAADYALVVEPMVYHSMILQCSATPLPT